jgi:hypothetical protein
MSPIRTTYLGVDIQVDWIVPNSGSLDIESYLIEILSWDGETFRETDSCDGQTSLILKNKFCNIPMKTLTSEPFSIT